MIKNILIAGGAGFIGSNLSLRLLGKGYNVRVMDNLSPQIHGVKPSETSKLYASIKDKVEFVHGTVTSSEDWKSSIEGMDAIIHLAAETGTGQSMYEIRRYCEVNSLGTALMLDRIANEVHTIKKIIIASSRAVYGEGAYQCLTHGMVYPASRQFALLEQGAFECRCHLCDRELSPVPTDEECKISPTSIYGITKYNQEQLVMTTCASLQIPSVAFRYQNVYGPGQSLSNPYTGILSIFSTRIKNNHPLNIFEDGKESRDFVYIDDVVDATVLGLENSKANGKAFNVGSGAPVDVLTVAKTLVSCYEANTPIEISGNFRMGDIRHNYADLTRIRSILGFTPTISFDEGITRFTAWVNNQAIGHDRYDESLLEMKNRGMYH